MEVILFYTTLCPHAGRKTKLSHATLILACAGFGGINFDTFVSFLVSGPVYNHVHVLCSQRARVYLNSGSLPDIMLAQNLHLLYPHVLSLQSTFCQTVILESFDNLKGCCFWGTKPTSGVHKQLHKLLLLPESMVCWLSPSTTLSFG